MYDIVNQAIQQYKGEDHVPFIDNLLQMGVSEEQVCGCVWCVWVCVCVCVCGVCDVWCVDRWVCVWSL